MFIEHLLCPRPHSKNFMCTLLLPKRQTLILPHFTPRRNCKGPKVTKQKGGRAKIWTQASSSDHLPTTTLEKYTFEDLSFDLGRENSQSTWSTLHFAQNMKINHSVMQLETRMPKGTLNEPFQGKVLHDWKWYYYPPKKENTRRSTCRKGKQTLMNVLWMTSWKVWLQ